MNPERVVIEYAGSGVAPPPTLSVAVGSTWAVDTANTVTVTVPGAGAGVSVTLTSSSPNGVVASSPVVTDGSGQAAFTVTPDSDGGTFTLTASATGYADATLEVTVAAAANTILELGFESGDFTVPSGWYKGQTALPNSQAPVVTTDQAATGSYSCRLRFGAGASGADSDSTLWLTTSSDARDEIWISYDCYIPANYAHRDQGSVDNNKWFIAGNNPTPTDPNANGSVLHNWPEWHWRIELVPSFNSSNISRTRVVWGNDQIGYSSETPPGYAAVPQADNYITEDDLGTWVNYGFHVKKSPTLADDAGEIRVYKNSALLVTVTGAGLAGPGRTAAQDLINAYEFGGYANSGFAQDTDIYIDNITIYDSDPGWVT